MIKTNSNRFFITLSTALLTCILFSGYSASAETNNEDYTQYVNPFVGTAVDNGQQFPGAVVPYGIVKLSPDTYPHKNDDHAGYDYNKDKIQGFSHTRVEGVGGQGSGGDVLITPTYVQYSSRPTAKSKAQKYSHKDEVATPGYYSVDLEPVTGTDENYKANNNIGKINAELTADTRTGMHTYTFPKEGKASILVDLNYTYHGTDVRNAILNVSEENNKTILSGRFSGKNVSGHGKYTLFYYIETELPADKVQTWQGDKLNDRKNISGNDLGAILTYNVKAGQKINMKVSISTISAEQAKIDMENEVAAWDFNHEKQEAKDDWNKILGKVKVESAFDSEKEKEKRDLFYTSLYRMFTLPVNATSTSGTYVGTDRKVYEANGYTHYDSWTLWDDFRKYPIISMIEPEIYKDIIQSIANMLNTGIDTWGSNNQSVMTVRNEHAVALLADGIAKGYTDINGLEGAYEAAKKIANNNVTSSVEKLGYFAGRVDKTVEYAYDDWALSIIATHLGKTEEAEKYLKRSFNYMNLFKEDAVKLADGNKLGLLWPKNTDGTWKNADPEKYGDNGLYQGTLWQYSWWDSNDIGGITELLGGKENLLKSMSYLYGEHDPDNGKAMLHSNTNEIDLQTPYMFNYAGKPSKTQYWTHKIYTDKTWNRYSGTGEFNPPIYDYVYKLAPNGFLETMDEDGGTMSAMYVAAGLGIFPMTPGDTSYQIGSPFFKKISLDVGEGRKFTIEAKNVSNENYYIQSAELNGKSYDQSWLDYEDLTKGGSLVFNMGKNPSTWAEDGIIAPSSSDKTSTALYDPNDEISVSSKTFKESKINDGSIENSVEFNLRNSSFNFDTGTDLFVNKSVNLKNIPDGLKAKLIVMNKKTAKLTLAGRANKHNYLDSSDKMEVEFSQESFKEKIDSKRLAMKFRVEFRNPTISFDKKILNEVEKDGSVNESVKISITDDRFTGEENNDFVKDGKVTISNLPSGLTARLIKQTNTELLLSFAGKAKNHNTPIKNIGISFNDKAFQKNKAIDISNSKQSGMESLVLNFDYDWINKLNNSVEQAKKMNKDLYAKGSFKALEKAIFAAEKILANTENVSIGELKNAYVEIETAKSNLKGITDGFSRLEGENSDVWTEESGINGPLKNESTNLGNIFNGAWIGYEFLDFGGIIPETISIRYDVNANRSAPDAKLYIYTDSMEDSNLIGSVGLEETSSNTWGNYKTKEVEIKNGKKLADGKPHNIFVVFKGSTTVSNPFICNLDYIQFNMPLPEKSLGRIQFEKYDDWSAGNLKVENSVDLDGEDLTNIGGTYDGAWLSYKNVNFGEKGISGIHVRYANNSSRCGPNARLIYYLDSMESEPIATVQLKPTGGNWNSYQTTGTEEIKATITGVHDVFVQMRVDSGYVSNLDYMELVANEEKIEVEKIELLTNAITTLKKGKNLTIKTKISPETATDKSVTWEVENNKIAEVSGDGTIIGLKPGITRVIARTNNGKEATFTLRVTQ